MVLGVSDLHANHEERRISLSNINDRTNCLGPEGLRGDFNELANYQKVLREYVKRNQWLVVDNIPGGAPIPQEVFDRIVHSITPKDY
jgi:hypothetical protein